jgi:hypothetical protein
MILDDITGTLSKQDNYYVIMDMNRKHYFNGKEFRQISAQTEVFTFYTLPDKVLTVNGFLMIKDHTKWGFYSVHPSQEGYTDLDVYDQDGKEAIRALHVVSFEEGVFGNVTLELEYSGGPHEIFANNKTEIGEQIEKETDIRT